MSNDPTDTFRQEAAELLEQLEQALLDLEQTPDNADLVNSAFRALHTIKGSGAMFGFAEVASFVHEFETAFDKVRKGQREATPELIAVALDAKDHVHKLIADASASGGDEILVHLRQVVDGAGMATAPAAASQAAPAAVTAPVAEAPAAAGGKTWLVRFKLPSDAFVNGTHLFPLLEEIEAIGPCRIRAVTDDVPALADLDPEVPHLVWEVEIDTDADPSSAIDDVFLFLRDGMELSVTEKPVVAAGAEIDLDLPEPEARVNPAQQTLATEVVEDLPPARAADPAPAALTADHAARAGGAPVGLDGHLDVGRLLHHTAREPQRQRQRRDHRLAFHGLVLGDLIAHRAAQPHVRSGWQVWPSGQSSAKPHEVRPSISMSRMAVEVISRSTQP